MLTNRHTGLPCRWPGLLKSGNRIYIAGNAATPTALIKDLLLNLGPLTDIEVVQGRTLSESPWVDHQYSSHFVVNTLFISGDSVRDAVAEGRADYTPCYQSEIPRLFYDQVLSLDAALVMVSPPDELGYCSLGVGVDISYAAVKAARLVIAQINPKMPRTSGNSFIHINQIDVLMEAEEELITVAEPELDHVSEQIGQYLSLLVPDRATLQVGLGRIPSAVLHYLGHHQDLGIHSETVSDGIMHLMKAGVITNRYKNFHTNKVVASDCVGSQEMYDFVDGNPVFEFRPSEFVNSPVNIARNDNMVSINSAIEVDLTGQVVADSIGHRFYSGIGGQVDFIRGTAFSKNGRPVIALPSRTREGDRSRIVARITEGSGVVTTRGDVHYVVTEYGIAYLRGKSVRERSLELIRIAHPDFRQELLNEVRRYYWVPEYQKHTPTQVSELGPVGIKPMKFADTPYILRPLNPSDERRLQEFFYSHNKETLMMRYNHLVTQMSREKSCDLVSVNQEKDLALCLTERIKGVEVIQGVARYYLTEKQGGDAGDSCEVAFVIKENKQGQGMGSAMLEEIIAIATSRGLSRIFAIVRADNKPMLKVFYKQGFERVGVEGGELKVELRLNRDRDASPGEEQAC